MTIPIALVGLPGAGKTRIGHLLAARLFLPFADTDAEIERAIGLPITDIFERDGEAKFRALERAAIDRLLDGMPLVLATGGGAMADDESRASLSARATTVWLDAPLDMLATRLAGTKSRPLLIGDSLARLATLKVERDPFYIRAGIRIDASGPPDAVTDAIVAALNAARLRPAAPAR